MSSDIKLYNMDCMEAMKEMPDKSFDLAIVDPPYGIGNFIPQGGKQKGDNFESVTWNDHTPNDTYFSELIRVSKEQIVWGANYYNCFSSIGGAIVWDKNQENPQLSRCEIASVTTHKRVAFISIPWAGFLGAKTRTNIHPCEKPVKLYQWLLKNYAKEGNKILDTHLGSGSIAIACYDMGYDLTGYEIDKEYFDAAVKRLDNHKKQLTFI